FRFGAWQPELDFAPSADACRTEADKVLRTTRINFLSGEAALDARSTRAIASLAAILRRCGEALEITAEHGHWRRVRDRDGAGGWIHYSLLSGTRTALVENDLITIYAQPDKGTLQVAQLELGVVARLDKCDLDWCRISAGGYRGWTKKRFLWGVKPDEVID
ncbi:MAG: SH3 domain-containing protein, partial [Pseudomonadota bacterium]